MFKALKTWQLSSSLKSKGNSQEAYSAVLELGRLGNDKAVEVLIEALGRRDGVSRSAARELGRIRNDQAIAPLIALLGDREVGQAAAEALLGFGEKGVGPLMDVLKSADAEARRSAAFALGEIRDKRALEPLILALQTDDSYEVRTAAATALGQLKDSKALWVLVGTLQMRDETTPERQAALEQLRQATQLAMRKIGDPLAPKQTKTTIADAAQAVVAEVEQNLAEMGEHPRLIGDIKLLNQDELTGILRELISASEEISWAQLESRNPLLPPYFKTYEQRAEAGERVGKELQRRGGIALMKKVLEQDLNSYSAISNWWNGIPGWK